MPTARDTYKQEHNRSWFQSGGAYGVNPAAFFGVTGQWFALGDVERRVVGGYTRYNKPDPVRRGAYVSSGASADPIDDFAEVDLMVARKLNFLSRLSYNETTPFTFYDLMRGTNCDRADNPLSYDIALITPDLRLINNTFMARGNLDGNDEIMDTYTASVQREPYEVGRIGVGQRATALTIRGTFGVVYGGQLQDASCGPPNAGDRWVYYGHLGDGTTNAPAVIYSLQADDGTLTEASSALTGATTAEVGKALVAYGNTLVAVTNLAYYVSTVAASGIPGAWTKVTTGLSVPTNAPNDAYYGDNGLIIVGNGGYIYRSINLTSGVTVINAGNATTANLNRVEGYGQTIVAGGASGALVRSDDGGQTWALMTSPGAVTITALGVNLNSQIFVGAGGTLYGTRNQGATYDTIAFPGSGTGTVEDIAFGTNEVIYLSHTAGAGNGRLYSSIFGGAGTFNGVTSWAAYNDPNSRVINLPGTFSQILRIAAPTNPSDYVSANNVALAGISTGTTGMLYVGRSGLL